MVGGTDSHWRRVRKRIHFKAGDQRNVEPERNLLHRRKRTTNCRKEKRLQAGVRSCKRNFGGAGELQLLSGQQRSLRKRWQAPADSRQWQIARRSLTPGWGARVDDPQTSAPWRRVRRERGLERGGLWARPGREGSSLRFPEWKSRWGQWKLEAVVQRNFRPACPPLQNGIRRWNSD